MRKGLVEDLHKLLTLLGEHHRVADNGVEQDAEPCLGGSVLDAIDLALIEYRSQLPELRISLRHRLAVDWPAIGIIRNSMKAFITRNFSEKQKILNKFAQFVGPQNGALGGAVGRFMKTIRSADLNIITAEYTGHEGRKSKPAHTKTVLASTDPVALDYYAGKYVLVPLGGKRVRDNDPDNPRGTFRQYLDLCHAQGIGTLNEAEMILHKYDFSA